MVRQRSVSLEVGGWDGMMGSMALEVRNQDQEASMRMGHPRSVWSAGNDSEPDGNVFGRPFIPSSALH